MSGKQQRRRHAHRRMSRLAKSFGSSLLIPGVLWSKKQMKNFREESGDQSRHDEQVEHSKYLAKNSKRVESIVTIR